MAQTVRIKHISKGWRTILCSGAMQSVVSGIGDELAADCNASAQVKNAAYEFKGQHFNYGGGRVGGFVVPGNIEACIDEAYCKTMDGAVQRL